jgi:integrase
VYDFLDSFTSYLINNGLATSSINLYVAAVKGYLANCDVELNPYKFRNKVTMPKNHREDEAAITDSDIRKILLACTNLRLKVYLLMLASGGMRATEALAIRLKDIDFSTTPTTIHLRAEYTKTKVSRHTYISEEATTYLKQWIERKYKIPIRFGTNRLRVRNENDLVFQLTTAHEHARARGMYAKMQIQFQKLLKSLGMEERKEGMERHRITLHSFRRFAKTVVTDATSTDYSEWFLGHKKSPYFVHKEIDKRMMYATKCMPFLTFINYSKLEQDATVKQSELEMLMVKDANKDREIELLKQKLQIKEREIDLLKQRDLRNSSSIEGQTEMILKLQKDVELLMRKAGESS